MKRDYIRPKPLIEALGVGLTYLLRRQGPLDIKTIKKEMGIPPGSPKHVTHGLETAIERAVKKGTVERDGDMLKSVKEAEEAS